MPAAENIPTRKLAAIRELTETILDPDRQPYTLHAETSELTALLTGLGTYSPDPNAQINAGETLTIAGLAISPRMAAMCAEDFVRTVVFMRGLHAAIRGTRSRNSGRPARVLYAGCGPLAILALPLMSVFAADEARFTLLDIHARSIESVKAVLASLGLDDHVEALLTMDAVDYRVTGDKVPDIVLLEMLRAILEIEPQVAVTRHLMAQAPDATLIPEQIDIDLELVNPSIEFSTDGINQDPKERARKRIPMGTAFSLNRETVSDWHDNPSERLPGEVLTTPDHEPQTGQPMLFTRIRVHGDHVLEDYASGLTCPRVLQAGLALHSGEKLTFFYQLGSHPRLVWALEQAAVDGYN